MRISITTNAGEYAARMTARTHALARNIESTRRTVHRVFRERAIWWSSGPYKQRELTRMGHPYARRNKLTIVKTAIKTGKTYKKTAFLAGKPGEGFPRRINVQTGEFRAAWRVRSTKTPNALRTELSNVSNRTRYLTKYGTSRMIGRDVMGAIAKDVRARTKDLWRTTVRESMQTRGGAGGMRSVGMPSAARLRGAFRKGFETAATLGG